MASPATHPHLRETFHARAPEPAVDLDPAEVVRFLLQQRLFAAAYQVVIDERYDFNFGSDADLVFRVAMYYIKHPEVPEDYERIHRLIQRGLVQNLLTDTQCSALLYVGRQTMPDALWISRLNRHLRSRH